MEQHSCAQLSMFLKETTLKYENKFCQSLACDTYEIRKQITSYETETPLDNSIVSTGEINYRIIGSKYAESIIHNCFYPRNALSYGFSFILRLPLAGLKWAIPWSVSCKSEQNHH